jgi:hypothetical protein
MGFNLVAGLVRLQEVLILAEHLQGRAVAGILHGENAVGTEAEGACVHGSMDEGALSGVSGFQVRKASFVELVEREDRVRLGVAIRFSSRQVRHRQGR